MPVCEPSIPTPSAPAGLEHRSHHASQRSRDRGPGTGANIRSHKNAEVRPTLVIVDDPQGRKHITSPCSGSITDLWFTQDLLNVGSVNTNYLWPERRCIARPWSIGC